MDHFPKRPKRSIVVNLEVGQLDRIDRLVRQRRLPDNRSHIIREALEPYLSALDGGGQG